MSKKRTILKVFCTVLLSITIGCGEDVDIPPDCGDPATISATPATPTLGGYPTLTDKTTITLFGTKSKNTSIIINNQEVVSFDCLTTWAADVSLNEGNNPIEILSLNRTSTESSSTPISITKGPLPSPLPQSKKVLDRLLCDVNGDGFDDVIVGSYENDVGGNRKNAGRVFIYYGGPSGPDTLADIVLTGEAAEDRFGISIACAGDVNGDGYSDVIVGAFWNDAGGKDAGRAYIFYGGTLTDDIPDLVVTGQDADDQFGTSVSAAGDVNGDGYDDVIVGAFWNDAGGKDAGRAYIYYGGSSMDNLPDAVLTGQAVGDQFGIRVAWAGDVNGDTYDDVIVGADRADGGGLVDAGKAYIFFGAPTENLAGRNASQADVVLEGATPNEAFASVARAGNLNGDSNASNGAPYDDVIVGASAYTAGSGSEICNDFVDNDNDGLIDRRDSDCHRGRAYIFLGGPSLTGSISANNADFILERPSGADGFGFSVASAGDVDDDGFGDLLVGAFLSDRTVSGMLVEDAGMAYLYFGNNPFHSAQIRTSPDVTFVGEASPGVFPDFIPLSGQFGFALSGAGKLNSDNLSDIVIGAYLHDTGILGNQTDVGRVYTFFGQSFASTVQASDACASATLGRCFTGAESSPLGPDNGFGISVQ